MLRYARGEVLGINLNILECKGICSRRTRKASAGINLNILECKERTNAPQNGSQGVLI